MALNELFFKNSVIKAGNKLKEVEVVQGGSVVLYDRERGSANPTFLADIIYVNSPV